MWNEDILFFSVHFGEGWDIIGVTESGSQSGISLDKAIAEHARRRTQASKEACLLVIKGRKKKKG